MRLTASSPAVMSTPASAYVRPGSSGSARSDKVGSGHVVALEHALVERRRDRDRVVAGEAGVAEAGVRRADGLLQVLDRQVGEALDAEVVLDLADRHVGGEQLGAAPGVHAVEA